MARVLFFARGALGLGQMRRILTLCEGLRLREPTTVQLVVTGSAVPNHFPLPDGTEYIRIPALTLVGPSQLAPRALPIPADVVRNLRRDLLWAAIQNFEPDALVVDTFPDDIEVLSALRRLRDEQRRTRTILGLRDIVADAAAVRRTWEGAGAYEALDELYDRILVFGCRDLFDVVEEYGLSPRAAAKTRFTGYLRREIAPGAALDLRAELGLGPRPLALVAAGGGQDGFPLLAAIESMGQPGAADLIDTLVVGGPLLPEERRRELAGLALPTVRFVSAVGDLGPYIAAADVVVAMAGYNTVCEILSFERPAILVPRVAPVREQFVRAEALSRCGCTRMILPTELTPDGLREAIADALAHPFAIASRPAMIGTIDVAAEIEAVIAGSL